jgi:fibronectin type 3 domain-containing protein
MKKWNLILVSILMMSLMGLAGCGGGGTDNPAITPQAVTTVPAAPIATAVGGINNATVSWPAVAGATSYDIYWSTTSGTGTGGTKIPGATSPYVHTGLTEGIPYYYVVTSTNVTGTSAPSAQVTATPTLTPPPAAPSAPTAVTAVVGATTVSNTNQITVTWAASAGATSYNIYWSTTSGTGTSGTKITAFAASPYTQVSLPMTPTSYYYVVTAVNTNGESIASVQASVATLDGALLYVTNGTLGTNCGSCHASLLSSAKSGVNGTLGQINTGIANNADGMGQFSAFTQAQRQAIANALF